MDKFKKLGILLLVLGLFFVFTACSTEEIDEILSNTIGGRVTYQGEPVGGVDVIIYEGEVSEDNIVGQDETASVGELKGTYKITGIANGEYLIRFFKDGLMDKTRGLLLEPARIVYNENYDQDGIDASLSDLMLDGDTIDGFDPDTLEYNVVLDYGTTVAPTVSATTNDPNATINITQADDVDGTATVVVTAEDGETTETYTINFSVALNDDASLSDLMLDGDTIEGFNPATLEYNVVLDYGTEEAPMVSATTNDPNATKDITQADEVDGTATVVVTAEDGEATETYTINFSVALNDDASLSDLMLDGDTIEGFDPDTLEYNIVLPSGTLEVPVVEATASDEENATVVITPADNTEGTATVVVTAEDGEATETYTINFTVAENDDATLINLTVSEGVLVPAFDSATTNYSVELPYGTTEISTVTATATDSNANVEINDAEQVDGEATVVVTAADGIAEKTYNINFTIADPNNDASLSDLMLDGDTIEGFDPATLEYNVELDYGTTVAPIVSVTTTDPNASYDITQADEVDGTATVEVTAEDGTTTKTYTINLSVAAPSTDATLSDILLDGDSLYGFEPGTLNYDAVLPYGTDEVPEVTAITNDPNASVDITQAVDFADTATIVVTAEDDETSLTYTVSFTVESVEGIQFVYEVDDVGSQGFAIYDDVIVQLEKVSDSLVDDVEPFIESLGLKMSYSTVLMTAWYETIKVPGEYVWENGSLETNEEYSLDPSVDNAWTWSFTLDDFIFADMQNTIEIALTNAEDILSYEDGVVTIEEKASAEFTFIQTTTVGEDSFELNLTSLTLDDFDLIYSDPTSVDLSEYTLKIEGTINDTLTMDINGIECQPLGPNVPVEGSIRTDDVLLIIDNLLFGDENTTLQVSVEEFILEFEDSLPANPYENEVNFAYDSIILNEGSVIVGDIMLSVNEYNTSFTTDDEGKLTFDKIVLDGEYKDNDIGLTISGIIEANFDYTNFESFNLPTSETNFVSVDITLTEGEFSGSETASFEYAKLFAHKLGNGNVAYDNYYGAFKFNNGISVEARFNDTTEEATDGVPAESIYFQATSRDSTYTLDIEVGKEGPIDENDILGYLMRDEDDVLAQVRLEGAELKVYFLTEPKPVVPLWTLATLRGIGLID